MIPKEYTDQDIIEEIKNIFPQYKTRKRVYVDRRNYLICILYYKFRYSEDMIADCFKNTKFKIDRSTVNHGKRQPIKLAQINDISFFINIALLYTKFPFDIPETEKIEFPNKEKTVYFDLKTLNRLRVYSKDKDITINNAVKELINIGLDITDKIKINTEWEE
jgi:hypothetical protein